MQELRERTVVKVIDGREFYRMELEDGTETHYLISKDGWTYYELKPNRTVSLRNTNNLAGNGNGYICADFVSNDNLRLNLIIHRLLLYNFIKNPLNLPQADHKDMIRNNNDLSNLRWIDVVANTKNRTIKSLNRCDYDHICWNPDKTRRNNGRWRFVYFHNGRYRNIKCLYDLIPLIEFRDKWLIDNGYPECLDLNNTI